MKKAGRNEGKKNKARKSEVMKREKRGQSKEEVRITTK